MAATGTASIAISRSTMLSVTLMPTLVSQRLPLETLSARFGHPSSISAITKNTPRKTTSRITPSLWPMKPSMS